MRAQIVYGKNNFELIEKTISQLKSNSPNHEGAILNSYTIKDLDNDGIYEIIETSNRKESTFFGFLNVEISPAFDFYKIYVLDEDNYRLSESDIGWFLQKKVFHYQLWRQLILSPENLSLDSKELIKKNKESFLNEIDWILKNINTK